MSHSTGPVVSIVTVAHNSREGLLKGLAAVQRSTEVPTEMIVVDNASTDNTAAAVRHAFRAVNVIRRDEPLPAPAALNLGAAAAKAPWLLFLDPGLEPLGDTIRTLVEHAGSHPSDRLCTGRTLRDRLAPRPYYWPHTGRRARRVIRTVRDRLIPTGRRPATGRVDDGRTIESPPTLLGTVCLAAGLPFDPERLPRLDRAIGGAVPALTPRMLLIERALWDRLGGFDERLPTADLSVRAKALGARPTLVPDAQMAAIPPERPTGRHAAPELPRPPARLVTTALLTERMAYAHRHFTPSRERAAGLILTAAAWLRSATGEPWLSIWRRRESWLDTTEPMPFVPPQKSRTPALHRDLSQP
ncbi:glycosyltransferase [Dactylosporangium vinaceum]|uniref:Glycosyltransferase family 2 protein n=1 Tax=Dactylosporangium vinaceum TaxID=53362 RepID=A0ABV5M6T0_9ACTN|nr:glycosyltransferase [Dactylosporangium vinaceum]UAB97945.1 glycosyltransferase [Dactylosporangium vinaceum]